MTFTNEGHRIYLTAALRTLGWYGKDLARRLGTSLIVVCYLIMMRWRLPTDFRIPQ